MMMERLKVFGGSRHLPGVSGQQRIILAATSQQRAAELLGVSLYEIQTWFSVSGNKLDLETALANPESVFYRSNNDYSGKLPYLKYQP